ncbi:hypothetical protein LSG31_16635 [Fodinisporobacter ferrooxydans]|uniref:Uncharacterized protein n=1 Tax=Fodinisporobacter ferrooxydans TaxID=2901836 RepID=A0ABY4CGT2_9BACL|nr:hypothetical protein LSG31_16635 [Alicyclobacillaceae bacterium MYW30-H2]
MWQAIGIIILFLVIAVFMFLRKIPTVLALPILAIGIGIIGGMPLIHMVKGQDTGLLTTVIEQGSIKLASAYIAVIFGAWLGQIMNQTGISKTMVKTAAELGGDRPFLIVVLLSIAVGLLFTTIGGLGATIMVASIVIPIFMSIGLPAITAVGIYLFAQAIGLEVNLSNWQLYTKVTGVSLDTVRTFALILAAATAIMLLIFAVIEFKRARLRFTWAKPVKSLETPPQMETRVPKLSLVSMIRAWNWKCKITPKSLEFLPLRRMKSPNFTDFVRELVQQS